ncbi:MIP/aquaporin family protein [Actinoplanes missouriensis]|uniref:MIP/aquaporin family protein n=1 Tax=Actinoplanes missouriensis TaxID=1866 RepID=UPI0033F26CC6
MTQSTGLHGHPIGADLGRAAVAELCGTFVLVLVIASTATAATLDLPSGAILGPATVPAAGAAALALAILVLGPISGAHLNPAVTVALAVSGRFPWRHVPLYLLAHLAGGVLAAFAVWGADGSPARRAGFGGPAAGIGASGARIFLIEALVTFVLVLVVVSVATDPAVPRTRAAIVIAITLGLAILVSAPISGAGVNPARALGPMIVAGRPDGWWAYLLGPLCGGVVAAALFERLRTRPAHPVGTAR